MPVDWFWVLRFGQIFGKICDFCCWSRVVRRRAWCICCDGSLAMCTVFIHTPRTIIHKTCTKTRKHPQKSVDIRITTHTHMVVLGLCWFVLKSWNHGCSCAKVSVRYAKCVGLWCRRSMAPFLPTICKMVIRAGWEPEDVHTGTVACICFCNLIISNPPMLKSPLL